MTLIEQINWKRKALKLLQDLKYLDWRFELGFESERPYLQVAFSAPCSKTGQVQPWKGRKWFLSYHATKSEIVGTAFMAVLTAIEHEARENFQYKGRAIYGPHFNVDKLHALAGQADCEEVRATPEKSA